MGWIYYGVRHTPAGEKTKKLLVGSSSSCFGNFPQLSYGVPTDAKIDNRMFLSTYFTREQFNKFVKALREEYAQGFTFEYNKGTKDELVRHFPRPTIGFYERGSKAKGYCDEFDQALGDKPIWGLTHNYISITIPEGANGLEAFAMLKVMTKQLCSPMSYRSEYPVWEKAYDETGNFQAACIVCCNSGATAGYTYPVNLEGNWSAPPAKDGMLELFNRKGPMVLPGSLAGLGGHNVINRYFSDPITKEELAGGTGGRTDLGHLNSWFNRAMMTSPKCFMNMNPSAAPRGSRELTNFAFSSQHLTHSQKEAEVLSWVKKALKGEYE